MGKKSFLFLILLSSITIFTLCYCKQTKKDYNQVIESSIQDSINNCVIVKNEVFEQYKRGNFFIFKECSNFLHAQEYFKIKYNLILHSPNKRYICAETLINSIVLKKYGNNFYSLAEKEIQKKYMNVLNYQNIDKAYYYAESIPEYKGGVDSLYKDIYKKIPKINCDYIDKDFGTEIIVKFVIDTIGNTNNIKVFQKLCPEIDSLVIETLKNLPKKWNPAILGNKKVPYIMSLSIDWGNKESLK